MKKLILILGIAALALTSCKKDDIKPNEEQVEEEVVDCNCGTVIQIVDTGMSMGNGWGGQWTDYKIKNNCTGYIDKRTHWSTSTNGWIPAPNVMDILCY